MPDIVLGVLIGVGATAVGAIITGFFNYKNSKLQIGARLDEARIDRLIRTRSNVLAPLREAMSKWLELSNSALTMSVRMGEANKRGADAQELRQEIQRWEEASRKSTQASSELEILRGQISDSKLDQMVEEAKNAQQEESIEIIKIVQRANNPQNWNTKAFEIIIEDLKSVHKRLRDKLLIVNKRIEELLSGEPSS